MPTFKALGMGSSAVITALVVSVLTFGPSTEVQSSSTGSDEKLVVVASSVEASVVASPQATAIEVLQPVSAAATLPDAEPKRPLTKSELANAKYAAGIDAYSAGEGRLTEALWTEAAEQGHMAAQWNLARLYRLGDLVEADPVKALNYLRIVASRHDPDRVRDMRSAMTVAAMVEIASMTHTGVEEANLAPDAAQAARLYELAATLYGNARAQHHLGMMYLSGDGVQRHIGRAVRWLALSAGKRYAPSLAALGDFFWENRNTGDNKVRGLMWLSLARDNAKHDDLRATVTDRFEAAMIEANEEERQQVMALIQTWNKSHLGQ